MFNNSKLLKISGLLFLGAILIYALFQYNMYHASPNESTFPVQVYFLNPLTNTLEPEVHYLNKGEDGEVATNLMAILYAGPKNSNFAKTIPDNVQFIDGKIVNSSTLEVEFSSEYRNMTPTEELFFRGSLVWTMTELDFIDNVHIYIHNQELLKINGEPMGYISRNTLSINPVISPDKINLQQVKLYFRNKNNNGLSEEQRTIEVNPDQPIERYVFEQLIAGPLDENLFPTVPPETKIRTIRIEEGVCYLNVSSDFVTKQPENEKTLYYNIYSVVNSITALGNVSKVQFMIEAEKIENFKGGFDLSTFISPDPTIILEP